MLILFLQETFLLDEKEMTMEGDGYFIARICSIVIVNFMLFFIDFSCNSFSFIFFVLSQHLGWFLH